ncbi:RHS repeat-associated core domain-containing protein [Pseudomonas sp. O230]|uniref:RHS repeat-associated core domain-containing protein n=1 Tax=Pseudomonas sp. O230 TaxID=3159450 RepID=UPI00387A97DA
MSLTLHRHTPSVSAIDGRGQRAREIAYLRKTAGASVETLVTRQHHDVAGRLVEQWDPRLFGSAPKPNLTTVHALSGQPLLIDSVDSGWRLNLFGMGSEIRNRWDERGNRSRYTYDAKMRLLRVDVNNQTNVEVLTYAQGDADPGDNLRGQLIKKIDSAGSMEFSRFGLYYQPMEETRTLFDGRTYITRWLYAADGKPLSQTDAGNHQQQSRYDICGQIKRVTLQIDSSGCVQDILKDTHYDANGQVIERRFGNGIVQTWTYDRADGRLTNIKAGLPTQASRQNLEYEYDNAGNVLHINDHTFKPVFFANQRIDGIREFRYDSLYRLTHATGHDAPPHCGLPGRPLPSDPNNRLNYKQTYEYDKGGNLIKLVHRRAVGGYTQEMRIDQNSNRGVSWKEGVPDFSRMFDRHGNLQALQTGQTLQWNNRDELTTVSLIVRETGLDDKETYRYSNGERIYKHHECHTPTHTHFHQVRYLPGLEIRTRETGEELHVIRLPDVIGNVRCLHWTRRQPDDIDPDQVRYCLEDSQSSGIMELDQHARLISHEDYYPFGGTACLTADSKREVSYKTIRYSGKEMDDSGLYYYGRRYYAPGLQRWISADPAGDVDGLNLYAMVGNNPMNFVDRLGLNGDLNQKVSNRTTAIIAAPTLYPTPKVSGAAKQEEAKKNNTERNRDTQFSTKYKNTVVVAHAGGTFAQPDTDAPLSFTDFFNIPIEKEGLTEERQRVVVIREADESLGRDHMAFGGILKITDPDKFTGYMSNRYIERFHDTTLPVRIYQGEAAAPIMLGGLEYEVPAIHEQIQSRIKQHIASVTDGLTPKQWGLPGAHAEVQAANFALYLQKELTGTTDPELVQLVTQLLKGAKQAIAFEACFNCTGILLASTPASGPFGVLTGSTNNTPAMWNEVVEPYRHLQ